MPIQQTAPAPKKNPFRKGDYMDGGPITRADHEKIIRLYKRALSDHKDILEELMTWTEKFKITKHMPKSFQEWVADKQLKKVK